MRRSAFAVVALAAVGFAVVKPSAGADAASRTVDRTFVCTPVAFGGVGDLDVFATPPGDFNYSRPFPAYLLVRTGGSRPDSNLVFVRARSHVRYPGLTSPHAVGGPGGVFAHRSRCTPARARIALSSKGLAGPPTRFGRDVDCPVRGRVLLRVRATLREAVSWRNRVDGAYAGARQTVDEAALAVRSQRTGAPVAYMELDAKGGTKLWYSGACS